MIHYNIEVVLRDEYDKPNVLDVENWEYYLPDSVGLVETKWDGETRMILSENGNRDLLLNGWRITFWMDRYNRYMATLEHDAKWNDKKNCLN